MEQTQQPKRRVTAPQVQEFFSWSELLDHEVLRPLSHIRCNWDVEWNNDQGRYEPEEESYAAELNRLIDNLGNTKPPKRYHDSEDVLAHYVISSLKWPIRKEKGRWVGMDYQSILEQGGFDDIEQEELLSAAAGRVDAAITRGQVHFDQMEESHRQMLASVLSISLFHRTK